MDTEKKVTDNGQAAEKEFESFLVELAEVEVKKMSKMNRKDLLVYAATTRVYLSQAFGLMTFAANALNSLQTQQLSMIEILKVLADKKTFEGFENSIDKGLDKTIEGIKIFSSKFSC